VTFKDIETALGQRLESLANVPPIAWPNAAFTPAYPYLEFRHSPNDVLDETGQGGYERQIGFVLVTVVTELNAFSNEANDIAEAIRRHFPKALRISAGDGTVLINAPTSIAAAFPFDGKEWRLPVRVSYMTEGRATLGAGISGGLNADSDNDGIEIVGNALRLDIDSLPLAPEN